ncbi:MAG: Lrp/AsnC family transcriptional regulator, partial [Marinovum sp.]|nr:Lrp/AsnC family transcriptional regulator [Marinovum sp.]
EHGFIKSKVAIVDAHKLGLDLQVFIQIRTSQHDAEWRKRLAQTVQSLPQIQSVHRMTGDLDYLIMARVANMAEYDALYQRLTKNVQMSDVSASFVMESLKETTEILISIA